MAIFSYDMASFYAKTVSDHSDAVQGDGWFTERRRLSAFPRKVTTGDLP